LWVGLAESRSGGGPYPVTIDIATETSILMFPVIALHSIRNEDLASITPYEEDHHGLRTQTDLSSRYKITRSFGSAFLPQKILRYVTEMANPQPEAPSGTALELGKLSLIFLTDAIKSVSTDIGSATLFTNRRKACR